MAKEMKWQSPYTDKTYDPGDPALAGRGNPPTCPDFANANPGMGNVEMDRVFVDVPDPEPEPEPEPDTTPETEPTN